MGNADRTALKDICDQRSHRAKAYKKMYYTLPRVGGSVKHVRGQRACELILWTVLRGTHV